MSARAYRVQVAERGASEIGTPAFTLSTELAAPPRVTSPRVLPAQGRTESRPFAVPVVDVDGAITSRLADADGRMHLLGRLVRVQESIDGGPWTAYATGRLSDLEESDGPGLYVLRIADERYRERHTVAWTRRVGSFPNQRTVGADTTQVFPLGRRYPYRGMHPAGRAKAEVLEIIPAESNAGTPWYNKTPRVIFRITGRTGPVLVPGSEDSTAASRARKIVSALDADLVREWVPPEGSPFATAQVHVEGHLPAPLLALNRHIGPEQGFFADVEERGEVRHVAVEWTDGAVPFIEEEAVELRILMEAHEPSDDFPLHVGVADTAHDFGTAQGRIHPFELVRRLYVAHGIRHDTAALQALIDNPRYPRIAPRIARQETVAEACERLAYRPFSVAPFIDGEGRVSPRPVHLPEEVDPDTLPLITPQNAATHPTWDHTRRDAVTVIRFVYESQRDMLAWAERLQNPPSDPLAEAGVDGIRARREEKPPREYDTVEAFGPVEVEVDLTMVHTERERPSPWQEDEPNADREAVADYLEREIFEMFGDGPIRGAVSGLSALESLQPGDLARIAVPTYPQPSGSTRGGERIVRVLQVDRGPGAPDIEFIDVGPSLQPMPLPTVSAAANADRPSRDIDVTLSDIPSGATATVQVASGSGEPGYDSDRWETVAEGLGNGTHTLTGFRPGQHWIRARVHAPHRIRSGWTTPASVTLEAEARISNVTLALEDGVPTVAWVPGALTEGIRIRWGTSDTADGATLDSTVEVAADASPVELDDIVDPGETIVVEVTPYTGWAGSAVSGEAGASVVRSLRHRTIGERLQVLRIREVARTDDTVTLRAETTPQATQVYIWSVELSEEAGDPDWAAILQSDTPRILVRPDLDWTEPLPAASGTRGNIRHVYAVPLDDDLNEGAGVHYRIWPRPDIKALDPETTELRDGSIKAAAQFAAGLDPVGVGPTLPPNGDEYRLWLLTSDNPPRLYRWDAGAGEWTRAVPTVDLDGVIEETQIAAGAVTEAKLAAAAVTETKIADDSVSTPKVVAGAIEALQIAAGAVLAEKIAAEAVIAEKIAALAVETDKLAANAVTAAKVAADAIYAGAIQAGAVKADAIDAGAVTAEKIDVDALSAISAVLGTVTVDGGNGQAVIFDHNGDEAGIITTGISDIGGHRSVEIHTFGPGGLDLWHTGTQAVVRFRVGRMGFYGATPRDRPTITGSRDGNAALASLLTELDDLGLVTDDTTA